MFNLYIYETEVLKKIKKEIDSFRVSVESLLKVSRHLMSLNVYIDIYFPFHALSVGCNL